DMTRIQSGRTAAIEDAIEIMPARGGKSGVEFAVGETGIQYHHRRGPQKMIEGIAHLVGRDVLLQVEMRHLAQGMHAGVGTPRAGDGNARTGKFLDGVFERALHGWAVVLALPADKGSAVIFQGQTIAHQEKRVPLGTAKPLSNSSAAITLPPAR